MKLSSLFLVNGIRVNGKMVTSIHYKDVVALTIDFAGQIVEILANDGFCVVTPFSNVKSMEIPKEWQSPQATKTAAQPSGSSSNNTAAQEKAIEKQRKQP